MNTVFEGRVWRFEDNVDTDHIIPTRNLMNPDPMDMSTHCFEDLRPEFGKERRDGDILVGGKNFGCGSSRQAAPLVIKNRGISCVVAESFARLFLRNSVNLGFPLVELKNAKERIAEGDRIRVDIGEGRVTNLTTGAVYEIEKTPPFLLNIYENGGLEPTIAKRMQELREAEEK